MSRFLVVGSLPFLWCCGDSGGQPDAQVSASAGAAGAAGASAGAGAGSGQAGRGGASGTSAAGAAGKGGSAGGSSGGGGTTGGGSGGAAGAVSPGGSAGAAVGGSAGGSGKGGANGGACKVDADCPTEIGAVPAGCAEPVCKDSVCGFRTVDKDGDGHRTNKCKADIVIALGDDCDDAVATVFPGAWDGPALGDDPNRCADGVDQDCSGTDGDSVGPKGESCTCIPGDVAECATDANGKAITYPGGSPKGECKKGSRTCVAEVATGGGVWSPCVGAVGPTPELCNGKKDDDCDGLADMLDVDTPPSNQVTFSYDGDGDGYVSAAKTETFRVKWCVDDVPTACPPDVPSCVGSAWVVGTLPGGDCDDTKPEASPAGVEICDDIDNDCSGKPDDAYATNVKTWVWDWDGDDYGDVDVKVVKACKQPTDVPAYCASLQENVPADYAVGLPAEGTPPSLSVPSCDAATMWKTGFPNTDCKDNPTQATGNRGNKPGLVHPGSQDFCNDRDYSCDGTTNTGCSCTVGAPPLPCGDAEKCNDGTQTCLPGGVLAECSGGNESVKKIYCPDNDGDTYCDLSKCTALVCQKSLPAGQKWLEQDKCTGFTIPNLGGSDCNDDPNDKGGQINPGKIAEVCDGSGRDYDCNGVTNKPGFGDCECVEGDKVACASAGNEYPVPPPADTYPLGSTPALQGQCVWGEKKCLGGSWSICAGGVGKTAIEQCTKDGKDYDCNGVKNNEIPAPPKTPDCNCGNGDEIACGPCGKGKATCINGAYGACSGDVAKKEYCLDGDGDKSCNGSCALYCPGTAPVSYLDKTLCQSAADCADGDPLRGGHQQEKCGPNPAGGSPIDEDCDGQVDEGYNVGATCAVGNGVGACKYGGKRVCTGETSAGCGASASVPNSTCHNAPLEPTQYESWDWDCNGAPNACDGAQALAVVTSVYPQDGVTVGTCFATVDTSSQAALDNICGQNDAASCTDLRLMTTAQCGASDCVSPNGTIFKTCRNFCGKQYTQVFCGATGGVCKSVARSVGPITRRFSTKTFGCR